MSNGWGDQPKSVKRVAETAAQWFVAALCILVVALLTVCVVALAKAVL
jgi:hypothetical protein